MPRPAAYTDEDEALAELMVGKVMEKYRKILPADLIYEMTEYLVDELLATADGRRKMRVYKAATGEHGTDPSADLERFPLPGVPDRKEGSGS